MSLPARTTLAQATREYMDAMPVEVRAQLRVAVACILAHEADFVALCEAAPKARARMIRLLQMRPGTHAISDWKRDVVWNRDGGRCQKCGIECLHRTARVPRWDAWQRGEMDHVVPKSKGGTNDVDNLRLLCRRCNRRKHVKGAEFYTQATNG